MVEHRVRQGLLKNSLHNSSFRSFIHCMDCDQKYAVTFTELEIMSLGEYQRLPGDGIPWRLYAIKRRNENVR